MNHKALLIPLSFQDVTENEKMKDAHSFIPLLGRLIYVSSNTKSDFN